jgi:poly-gamma-glutamate capsule biosynthesis protein CapA/YwtB (metallophosphatase superfamily)
VIADSGSARPGPYRLRARPGAAEELRQAGFDLLGLANNHALDYGSAALAETISRLEQAGLATMGVGLEPASAASPVFRDIGGLRLAFVAFSTVPDPEADTADRGCTPALSKLDGAVATVAAARAQADAVIVSVHWGYEYELAPDPSQRRAAQALLDAGADLVVGHHPHVVQGTEIRYGQGNDRDRFVAFSLGNLLFDQEQGESRQGLVLTALFDRYGLRAVQALPIRAGPHPQLVAVADAAATLARIQPPARRIGFACHASSAPGGSEACRPVEVPQTPGKGCFTFGETDLTGDGLPEQVQIEREQVSVFHEGVEVWRGLAGWRVVDLALGDANDDGRSEMLLALYKADDDGLVHSHPFLIGYREGAYRILWGGSAVADPLQEVELGDVDGDGVQELIVLEKQGGSQALTVWRWHGWGFSLEWRSSPGHYRDLALLPQSGAPPLITVGLSPN